MLQRNKNTSREDIMKNDFSTSPNYESDDDQYVVMRSPYTNEDEAFRCLNQVKARNFLNPPERKFKQINLVPLPALPTEKKVIQNEYSVSKKQTELEVTKGNWKCRILQINNVKTPSTDLKFSASMSQSQAIQKQISKDGMFAKEKDFKGDLYYYSIEDHCREDFRSIDFSKHAKVYEELKKLANADKRPMNIPNIPMNRTLSNKETHRVQQIIPRRPAPPPPLNNVKKLWNRIGTNAVEKKGKEPNLKSKEVLFEDFSLDSKFSNHAEQLKERYEYLC